MITKYRHILGFRDNTDYVERDEDGGFTIVTKQGERHETEIRDVFQKNIDNGTWKVVD